MMPKRVLLTGADGFVGSHVLRHLLTHTDWDVICPVTFRHTGKSARLASALGLHCGRRDHPQCQAPAGWEDRVQVILHDLAGPFSPVELAKIGKIDYVLNLASESHVQRAIDDPVPFVRNNVDVALNMLEFAREAKPEKFVQISTDEVYGPATRREYPHGHPEWSPILPSNPYSASKAAQEALAISWWRTYSVPVIITNTMNLIGELQDPEKFVPGTINRLLETGAATAHVDVDGTPSSRFWLHARGQAEALLFILDQVQPQMFPRYSRPTRLNVVGEREIDLNEMITMLAGFLGIENPKIVPIRFHDSRPGHDLRYGLDGTKMAAMGWKPSVPIEESLRKTVDWLLEHPEWLSGRYDPMPPAS